jgi:hypothetical protein
MPGTRRRWTDQLFQDELREVVHVLGHFPSNRDLIALGRHDLANQVQRRGGFLTCSEQMGFPRQRSDSDTGWDGEDRAADRLRELGFDVVVRSGVKCPYDLLVAGVLRVDVKAARLHRYGHTEGWFYRLGKYSQADIILLWQLDSGHFYAVPWFVCPSTNITISKAGGKYQPFFNNVDLIRRMIERRSDEYGDLHSLIGSP